VVWYWVYETIFHLLWISGGVDRSEVVVIFYLYPNLLSVTEKEECVTSVTSNDLYNNNERKSTGQKKT
jgi:hypothetical protein